MSALYTRWSYRDQFAERRAVCAGRTALGLLAAFLSLFCTQTVQARVDIYIWQVGSAVTAAVTGSLDTDVLVFDNGKPLITSSLSVSEGIIQFGDGSPGQIYQTSENDWGALGPGGFAEFDYASGDVFGLLSDGYVALAPDYVSGAPLYSTIVKNNSTLAELGLETGTFSYSIERQGKSERIEVSVGRSPRDDNVVQIVEFGSDVQVIFSARLNFDPSAARETIEMDKGLRFSGPDGELFNDWQVVLGSGEVTLYDYSDDFFIKYPSNERPEAPWILDLEENAGDAFLLEVMFGSGFGADDDFLIGLPPNYRSGDLLRATGIARNTSLAQSNIQPDESYEFGAAGGIVEVVARVEDAPFRVRLEEPVNGQPISGIGNLRGFAFAEAGIEKVEIYIDGEYDFDAPYGGSRNDVGNAFPEVEGSADSGFSLAYGYTNLSPGTHTITARAINTDGVFVEDSATFEVLAFDEPFISASQVVDLGEGAVQADGDEISLENVEIAGQVYDLTLKWRTATQGFEIIEVR